MSETERTERRRNAQREAEKAIREEDLEKVLRAAGAIKIEKNATRVLKAVAASEIAEFAVRAQDASEAREESELNAECIACGAAQRQIAIR